MGSSGSPMVRANTLVEPPGSGGQGGVGAGEAVGRLVQGAVAAEHDDDVDAVGGRALGQAGGVAAAVGLGHASTSWSADSALLDHDPAAGA